MATYASTHDPSLFSRRALVLVIAGAVQVLGFIGLTLGLANKVLRLAPQPFQTSIVQEVQKHVAPPPPPPPTMAHPPVVVPPPEVSINIPVETSSSAITNVTDKKVVAPPPRPAPVHQVVYTSAQLDMSRSPSTDDYYPPYSRRLGEQGMTTVRACPGPGGRVAGQPTVLKSSGSPRLDQAALRWAEHARFTPATADGRPVTQCIHFSVLFKLTGVGN
jgi:periplasmic protein TonB